jgi:hypothetical protein
MKRYSTPPAIAKRYGITTGKVIDFIEAGEIEAVNLARRGCTRPRYHVSPEALEKFERSRLVVPAVTPVRRRKAAGTGRDWLAD